MRLSRGSVRQSILPSIHLSDRMSITSMQKTRFSAVFGHGEILYWIKRSCFESLLDYSVVSSVCSSICLSIYVTCSIHTETQERRHVVAQLGLFWVSLHHIVCIIDTDVLNLFNHIRYMMKVIFMLQAGKTAIAEKISD